MRPTRGPSLHAHQAATVNLNPAPPPSSRVPTSPLIVSLQVVSLPRAPLMRQGQRRPGRPGPGHRPVLAVQLRGPLRGHGAAVARARAGRLQRFAAARPPRM
eukprot:5689195-Pyramimonas_sp.AAC.1